MNENAAIQNNFCSMPRQVTWRDRVRWRFFPAVRPVMPDVAGHKDGLFINSVSDLSWRGRLLIFLTGRLAVQSRTSTQNEIGDCTSVVEIFVLPPKWLDK